MVLGVLITCALSVGASPEIYLEAMLASIGPIVDLLVVNDNAGDVPNPNLATLEASELARSGRMRVVRTRFVDYATMRNDAFAALGAAARPDWVLWLDADEVHGAEIGALVHGVIPKLGSEFVSVESYKEHFVGSFRWISDVARCFCAYRFDPSLRWRNAVHEKLEGLHGKTIVLPYRIAHYGAVLPPALYAAKARRYAALGQTIDNVYPEPNEATVENIYARKAKTARRFRGTQPPAAQPLLARLERDWSQTFREVDLLFTREQTAFDRAGNAVHGALEETRIALRYLEHPGVWPPRDFPKPARS